jgi:hypothetical protein
MTKEAPADAQALRRRIDALPPERRRLLERRLAELGRAARRPIPRLPRSAGDNRFPSTADQERLFFQQQLRPGSAAYVLAVALRLTGAVREHALHEALATLVRRHEPLRTGFRAVADEGLIQVVRETAPLPYTVETVRAADLPELLSRFAGQPFDLSEPPLMRAALWRLADGNGDTWTLALAAHHLIMDGWSLGVLLDDLGAALTDVYAGRDPDPAPLPVQFADFAAWERDREASPEAVRQLAYWRRALAGARSAVLPVTADPRPDPGSSGSVPVSVPPALTAALTRVTLASEATPFMALLSALAVVLWRWTGQADLTLCTATAGRPKPELERLVGFFANTVPLRVRLDTASTFADLLATVRAECVRAYANQDVPLHRILAEAEGGSPAHRVMRLPVMVALRDVPVGPVRLPGLAAEILDMPQGEPDFELSLDLFPRPDGGLSGRLGYAPALFARETAERIAAALLDVLGTVAIDPSKALGALPPADSFLRGAHGRQVVVGGHLVDPDEVASALRALPDVDDALVLAQTTDEGDHRLLGYLTGAQADDSPDIGLLLIGLTETLPAPLIPEHLIPLKAFPLTASGLIDRGALPVPESARSRPSGAYEPPIGALERVLADIWARALDIDPPGRADDFFRLGGHSLLATLMVSQIRELFRVELPLHFFVEAPTIESLADLIRARVMADGNNAERIAELVLRVQGMSTHDADDAHP